MLKWYSPTLDVAKLFKNPLEAKKVTFCEYGYEMKPLALIFVALHNYKTRRHRDTLTSS